MKNLKDQFENAITDSKNLPAKPDNEILLQLYALYKQSTAGDVNIEAPTNPFDFVGKAKYEAWALHKSKTNEAAMEEYVALVKGLKNI